MARFAFPKKRKKGSRSGGFTRRDKLHLAAWVAGLVLIVLVKAHFFSAKNSAWHLDQKIVEFSRHYRLTPEQLARIREIEREFHDCENSHEAVRDAEKIRLHREAVAAVLTQEERMRFLGSQYLCSAAH